MRPVNHHILSFFLFMLLASPALQAATADDVECIRCVDMTDINYDAVTSNRILDGTIRTSDIGLDAVTSSRIRAGEVRTSDLAPGAVTTSRIMNGAVTEAKLAQELLDIIEDHLAEREHVPDLELSFHELSQADFDTVFQTGSLHIGKADATLGEIVDAMERTYCKHVGAEFMHIVDTEQRHWVMQRMESVRSAPDYSREVRLQLLSSLIQALDRVTQAI